LLERVVLEEEDPIAFFQGGNLVIGIVKVSATNREVAEDGAEESLVEDPKFSLIALVGF